MKNLKNRVAVISGAGSGIGQAIAISLAKRGCHLALADINPDGLNHTLAETLAFGVNVTLHQIDVADRLAVNEFPDQVLARHGRIDLLINNAGVALGGTFEQVSEENFDWLMDVNFHGMVRMTRAFLPALHAGDDASLVNISSLWGLVAPANQTAYSASKFAVRGFSNALRHELEGSTISVSVVHPGGVATSIAKNARVPIGLSEAEVQRGVAAAEKTLRMPPARAGEIIVRGIEQRRARILVGADAIFISLLERVVPVQYWRFLKRLIPS